jgi:flagellar protein FlaF
MGFSVSGSAAVIFLGVIISLSIATSALQTTSSGVTEAWNDRISDQLAEKNTEIAITNTSYNGTIDELTVNATNNGTTTLSVDKIDLLVDGRLKPDRTADIVGADGTEIWLSGERLVLTANATDPNSAKVVVENGVSDFEEVGG